MLLSNQEIHDDFRPCAHMDTHRLNQGMTILDLFLPISYAQLLCILKAPPLPGPKGEVLCRLQILSVGQLCLFCTSRKGALFFIKALQV